METEAGALWYHLFFFVVVTKQKCRKVCFCLPPELGVRKGRCPERQHQEDAGNCRAEPTLLSAKPWGLCCTWQTSGSASAFLPCPGWVQGQPKAGAVAVHLSAHPTSCASTSCCLQSLSQRMRLLQNGEKRLGQKDPSIAQSSATLSKGNPSFLSQKLFASVLFGSHYFINSINSYMGPLTDTVCFPAWLTPKISILTNITSLL